MLTQFLEIKAPIANTLKELNLESKCLTEDEVAAVCRRDITVPKSEKIFE